MAKNKVKKAPEMPIVPPEDGIERHKAYTRINPSGHKELVVDDDEETLNELSNDVLDMVESIEFSAPATGGGAGSPEQIAFDRRHNRFTPQLVSSSGDKVRNDGDTITNIAASLSSVPDNLEKSRAKSNVGTKTHRGKPPRNKYIAGNNGDGLDYGATYSESFTGTGAIAISPAGGYDIVDDDDDDQESDDNQTESIMSRRAEVLAENIKRLLNEWEPSFNAGDYSPGDYQMPSPTGNGVAERKPKKYKGDDHGTSMKHIGKEWPRKHKDTAAMCDVDEDGVEHESQGGHKSSVGKPTDGYQTELGHNWPDGPHNDGNGVAEPFEGTRWSDGGTLKGHAPTGVENSGRKQKMPKDGPITGTSGPQLGQPSESWNPSYIGSVMTEGEIDLQQLFDSYARDYEIVCLEDFQALCNAHGGKALLDERSLLKLMESNREFIFYQGEDANGPYWSPTPIAEAKKPFPGAAPPFSGGGGDDEECDEESDPGCEMTESRRNNRRTINENLGFDQESPDEGAYDADHLSGGNKFMYAEAKELLGRLIKQGRGSNILSKIRGGYSDEMPRLIEWLSGECGQDVSRMTVRDSMRMLEETCGRLSESRRRRHRAINEAQIRSPEDEADYDFGKPLGSYISREDDFEKDSEMLNGPMFGGPMEADPRSYSGLGDDDDDYDDYDDYDDEDYSDYDTEEDIYGSMDYADLGDDDYGDDDYGDDDYGDDDYDDYDDEDTVTAQDMPMDEFGMSDDSFNESISRFMNSAKQILENGDNTRSIGSALKRSWLSHARHVNPNSASRNVRMALEGLARRFPVFATVLENSPGAMGSPSGSSISGSKKKQMSGLGEQPGPDDMDDHGEPLGKKQKNTLEGTPIMKGTHKGMDGHGSVAQSVKENVSRLSRHVKEALKEGARNLRGKYGVSFSLLVNENGSVNRTVSRRRLSEALADAEELLQFHDSDNVELEASFKNANGTVVLKHEVPLISIKPRGILTNEGVAVFRFKRNADKFANHLVSEGKTCQVVGHNWGHAVRTRVPFGK